MEYLFDTANLEAIATYSKYVPITGVTSNPSIVKKEGNIDFFAHMNEIRRMIGMDKTFHIQVTGLDYDSMMSDADTILNKVDDQVYIKVPVTLEGLSVIRALKAQKINVTATAIYTEMQGFLAIASGADYLAPYYNRMENNNTDPDEVVSALAQIIAENGSSSKILAASFKNMGQVNRAFLSGAHAATIATDILTGAFANPFIQQAVDTFSADWQSIYGDKLIHQL